MFDDLVIYLILTFSAFLAGVMNSIAGGGTLLTFPAPMAVVAPSSANGTSTIALMPGSLLVVLGMLLQSFGSLNRAISVAVLQIVRTRQRHARSAGDAAECHRAQQKDHQQKSLRMQRYGELLSGGAELGVG